MGINDICFTGNEFEIVTCSSDRTVKVWKVNMEGQKLEEVRSLELSGADAEQIKDNVDKQLLGLAYNNVTKCIMTASCNSEINMWNEESNVVDSTVRGHTNSVT